jgi:hypothetical protein
MSETGLRPTSQMSVQQQVMAGAAFSTAEAHLDIDTPAVVLVDISFEPLFEGWDDPFLKLIFAERRFVNADWRFIWADIDFHFLLTPAIPPPPVGLRAPTPAERPRRQLPAPI